MKEFFLMIIMIACMSTCTVMYETHKDIHYLRKHIEHSTLKTSYRDTTLVDSVAIDSTVVYKVR